MSALLLDLKTRGFLDETCGMGRGGSSVLDSMQENREGTEMAYKGKINTATTYYVDGRGRQKKGGIWGLN